MRKQKKGDQQNRISTEDGPGSGDGWFAGNFDEAEADQNKKLREQKASGKGRSRSRRKYKKSAFSFSPLASYRGMAHRLILIYKHIIGLLIGALVVHVQNLSEIRKKGLRSRFFRVSAFLLKPFIRKDVRYQPFEKQLRKRLELLGPAYIKLGQIMAIREDLLPRVVTDELQQLLDHLPEVPFEEIKSIIEENLEQPLELLYKKVEMKTIGSASIAQTHRAVTYNDEMVVIKVIKPGIRDVVEIDLKLLQKLSGFLEWLIPQYQPKMIINEFSKYTRREIDLTYEADNAELFAANFADWPDVVFPTIYRSLSTRDVLTMSYLEGEKPNNESLEKFTEEERDKLLDQGAGAIIKMLYEDGFFHADLHPGNILVMPGPKIGFLDLGMAGRFEEKTRRFLLYYFYSMVRGDVENSTRYLLNIAHFGDDGDPQGFKRAVNDLLRRYTIYSQMGEFSLGRLILESLRIGSSHNVFFPVEMTLMVKALITFEGVGMMIQPNLDVPGLSRKHVTRIYTKQYNVLSLGKRVFEGSPEFIDTLINLPQLISDGARYLEETLNDRVPEKKTDGNRSAIISSAFIISGVLALVQDAHVAIPSALLAIGVLLALFGRE